eukprot:3464157-Rhodomonas_salina.3
MGAILVHTHAHLRQGCVRSRRYLQPARAAPGLASLHAPQHPPHTMSASRPHTVRGCPRALLRAGSAQPGQDAGGRGQRRAPRAARQHAARKRAHAPTHTQRARCKRKRACAIPSGSGRGEE